MGAIGKGEITFFQKSFGFFLMDGSGDFQYRIDRILYGTFMIRYK